MSNFGQSKSVVFEKKWYGQRNKEIYYRNNEFALIMNENDVIASIFLKNVNVF